MVDISVIIVNYNSKDYLRGCIDSIDRFPHEIKIEILVSDNNSTDGSIDMIKNDFPQIRLIENKDNIGYSAAANKAIRKSSGRYILILNNDIEALEGSLDTLVKTMDEHPDIGLLGCMLLNSDGTLQQSFGYFNLGFLSEVVQKFILNRYRKGNRLIGNYLRWAHKNFREVDWIKGACIMARRQAIDAVGLMDENYFLYFEEIDLCNRVRKGGWKVCYTPEARMIHYEGKSTTINSDKAMIEYRKSQLYFYKKHYGSFHMRMLKGYLIIKIFFGRYVGNILINSLKGKKKGKAKSGLDPGQLLSVIWRYR